MKNRMKRRADRQNANNRKRLIKSYQKRLVKGIKVAAKDGKYPFTTRELEIADTPYKACVEWLLAHPEFEWSAKKSKNDLEARIIVKWD